VSTKPIAACGGLVPVLARVKTRVEVPPALMVDGVNALVRVGVVAVTTRHWSDAALRAPWPSR
jgi:hypothetical protein